MTARTMFWLSYPPAPKNPVGAWAEEAMKKSIGIDSIVLVREARNAILAALVFSSADAGTIPNTFF